MTAFKRLALFVLVLSPVLILGYQNCSELSQTDLAHKNGQAYQFAPGTFNSISALGYAQGNCAAAAIAPVEVFSSKAHICALATDSCELFFLESNSFQEDLSEICETAVDINSQAFVQSLSLAIPEDFGFTIVPDAICTYNHQRLLSIKHRKCVDAANGCEISFLKNNHGFLSDNNGLCD